MSAKTILVTGGAGFIGSNFARHLYNKYPDYRVLVVDALTYAGSVANLPEGAQQSGRYEFWYGDVRNGELMDALISRADVVVHMAAESHVTRSIYDNRLFFETDVLVVVNGDLVLRAEQACGGERGHRTLGTHHETFTASDEPTRKAA